MGSQEASIIPLYYQMDRMGPLALILPQIGMSVCLGTFWIQRFFAAVPRDLVDSCTIWCMAGCTHDAGAGIGIFPGAALDGYAAAGGRCYPSVTAEHSDLRRIPALFYPGWGG